MLFISWKLNATVISMGDSEKGLSATLLIYT